MNTATQKNTMQDQQHNKKAAAFTFKLKPVMTALVGVFGGGGMALAQFSGTVTPTGIGMKVLEDGKRLNVTTTNVRNDIGINAFSAFQVNQGSTVNLHIPAAATKGLLNLVDSRIVVDGTVNSILSSGKIGGNVIFASPNGMVVGKEGVLNVGSLAVRTPDQTTFDLMKSYAEKGRQVHTEWVTQDEGKQIKKEVVDVDSTQIDDAIALTPGKSYKRNSGATVEINGKVYAPAGISIDAASITVTGSLVASDRAALVTSLNGGVNAKSTNPWGTGEITGLVADKDGFFDLVDSSLAMATGDIALKGQSIVVSGAGAKIENSQGGAVDITAISNSGTAGPSITLSDGGNIATKSGAVKLFAWAQGGSDGDSAIKLDGSKTAISSNGGNVEITAWNGGAAGKSSIELTNGAAVNTNMIDPNTLAATGAGKVTLAADSARSNDWKFTNFVNYKKRDALVNIDGTITSGAISAKATATDTFDWREELDHWKIAKDIADGGGWPDAVRPDKSLLGDVFTTLLGVNFSIAKVDAKAAVTLGKQAMLSTKSGQTANGNVKLLAEATSKLDLSVRALAPVSVLQNKFTTAFAYGEMNANSAVTMAKGARIESAGSVDIDAKTNTRLNVSAGAMSSQTMAVLTGAVGVADVHAKVDLAAGSVIVGHDAVTIDATNLTDSLAIGARSLATGATAGRPGVNGGSAVPGTDASLGGAAVAFAHLTTEAAVSSGANITSTDNAVALTADNQIKANSLSAAAKEGTTFNGIETMKDLLNGDTDFIAANFLKQGLAKVFPKAITKFALPYSPMGEMRLSAAGAFALGSNTHSATAKVQDAQEFEVGGKKYTSSQIDAAKTVAVKANLLDAKPGTSASSEVMTLSPNGASGYGLSVALALNDYKHTVEASVGERASVTAEQVDVKTNLDLTNPVFNINWGKPEGFMDVILDGVSIVLNANGSTAASSNAEGDSKSLAASVSWLTFDNTSKAEIKKGANITLGSGPAKKWEQFVDANLSTDASKLTSIAADFVKANSGDLVSGTDADQTKAAKGLEDVLKRLRDEKDAANIRTIKAEWVSTSGIKASVNPAALNVDAKIKVQNILSSGIAPVVLGSSTGQKSSKAIGPNLNYFSESNKSSAVIGAAVNVKQLAMRPTGVSVNVSSLNDVSLGQVTWASGKGSGTGLNGMLAIADINNSSHAYIDRSATVDATGVTMDAKENLTSITAAGAISLTSGTGVGLSGALNFIDSDTQAGVVNTNPADFNEDGSQKVGTDKLPQFTEKVGSITANNVVIKAATSGTIWAGTVTASASSDAQEPPKGNGSKGTPPDLLKDGKINDSKKVTEFLDNIQPGKRPAAGFTASAAVSLNSVAQTTKASVVGGVIKAPQTPYVDSRGLDISAVNDSLVVAFSGGLSGTKTTNGDSGSSAYAGAFSVNTIENLTAATITAANATRSSISNMRHINVDALANGKQYAISVGAAVNASAGDANAKSGAGSAAASSVQNTVTAELDGVDLQEDETTAQLRAKTPALPIVTASSLKVLALDNTIINTGAGGLAAGGKNAAGGAVTYSKVRDTVKASIKNSKVTAVDAVAVNAIAPSKITSVTVGAAVSTEAGGGGYAGSIALNQVNNTITASVADSDITKADSVRVLAADGVSADVSADVANQVKNNTEIQGYTVSVDDMNLDAAGMAKLNKAPSRIINVALSVGAATAPGKAAGLVVGYNTIHNTFTSEVARSAVSAKAVSVKSQSDAYIMNVGAGAAGSSSGMAGAGVIAVSEIGNTVSASVYSSKEAKDGDKLVAGSVNVSAVDQSNTDNFIGGLAISLSSNAVGVSIASSTIANTVTAEVKDVVIEAIAPIDEKLKQGDPDSYVDSESNVAVDAVNTSTARTVTLAAAVGSGTSGAGVAANSRIHNTTSANFVNVTTQNTADVKWQDKDDKARVSTGKVKQVAVAAQDKSSAQTFAFAAGVSGSAAVGAAITDSIVENKTHAYLTGGVVNAGTVKVDSSSASTVETMAIGVGGSKGGLAVSGSVVVNVVDNTTDAKIDGGAKVTAQNNVRVTAKGDDHIEVAAGSASFSLGGSGVGASVISNNVTSDTLAHIDGSTTEVNAYGVSAPPSADDSAGNTFYNYGSVDSKDTIDYYYKNSNLASKRYKNPGIKGVEVNASSTQFVGSIVANVAGGKDVGAAGNIQVNSIVGKTQAYVNEAKVMAGREEDKAKNITASSGDVKVLAGNLSVSSGFAGAVGVGGKAGMGVGFDGAAQKHVTEAFLKGATVTARDIEVGARSAQATSSIAVAGGASKGFAMGVTGSITHFDGQTRAYIENGTTNAGGALRVTADSTTQAFAIGGALAGSGGPAAAVGIVNVNDNNITEAYIAGVDLKNDKGETTEVRRAKADATEGVTVAATSKTTIRDFAVGVAGSGAVGIAGTVTVNTLLNTTEARVERADIGTKAGDVYKTGSLNVTANSSNAVFGVAGALGVGVKGGGLGASLLVNDIGNTARSVVFDSNVKVKNALTVQSTNQNTVEDYVVTGGGGLWAGVGAATVVTLVGAESGVEQADAINTKPEEGTTKVLQDAQGNIRELAKTGQKDTTTFDKVFLKKTGLNESTAQIGGKTVLDVGTLTVKAIDKTSIDNLAGGAAVGGGLGVGASTSVAISRATVTALVDDSTYTEVRDLGVNSVEVSATATDIDDKTDKSTGKLKAPDLATISAASYAGAAGLGGVANTVSKVKLKNTVLAHLGGRVAAKSQAKVAASDKTSLKSRVFGAGGGAYAQGLTFNILGKTSQVTAELGADAVDVNRLPLVGAAAEGISTGGSLSVSADNSGALRGYTMSGSIGAVAVQVSAGVGGTQINDSTRVTAQTLGGTIQNAKGGMSVLAKSAADVVAQNWGLSVGGLGVGVSEAQGIVNQRVSALLGNASNVTSSGDVKVDAQQTMARVSAFTSGASGGLVGIAGTTSIANNTSEITSAIGEESSIETNRAVTVNAAANSLQTADAWGVAVGAIGAGTHTALAQSATKTKAMLGKNVDLHGVADGKGGFDKAGDLTVTATSADQNFSRAKSGSGGLVGGADANALTISNSTTEALIGQGIAAANGNKAKMLKVSALKVEATHTALFNGVVESFNFNVAGGGSGPYAKHLVSSTVKAELGDSAQVEAESLTINANSTTKKENKGDTVYNYNTLMVDWDANKVINWNIDSRSGALLVDIPVGTAITEVTKQDTTARIGNGAHVQLNGKQAASSNALVMDAINSIDIYDKVGVDTGGLVPVASAKSLLTVKNTSTNATIGGLAKVKANKGAIAVGARTDAKLSAEAVANTYGLAGSPFGSALASYSGSDNVTVGASAELLADYNSVNLSAGRSTSGTESSVETSSKVNIWNKTLVPIKNPPEAITNIDSQAKLATHGLSKIQADGDVNLIATRGTLKATALGISRDLYGNSKVQSGSVSDLLDKDGIPTQTVTGNAAKPTGTAQVVVDGTVETGIHRVQWLTIDDAVLLGTDGKPVIDQNGKPVYVDKITKSEGFGDVSIAYNQGVAQALYARLQTKRKQALDYAGTASAGAYANEVTFLEKQLLDLGFASKVANGKGGYDIVMGTGGGVGISPKAAVQQQITASQVLVTDGEKKVKELTTLQGNYSTAKSTAETALKDAPTKAANAEAAFIARANALDNWLTESKNNTPDASKITGYKNAIGDAEKTIADSGVKVANYTAVAPKADTPSPTQALIDGAKANAKDAPAAGKTLVAAAQTNFDQQNKNYNETGNKITETQTSIAGYKTSIETLTKLELTASDVAVSGPVADFVTTPDIKINLGSIRVKAESLSGIGTLNAPGDAKVTITNNTSKYLTVGGISINSASDGARVVFNGKDVGSNVDVNAINAKSAVGNVATFAKITTLANGDKPLVDIVSNYNPDSLASSQAHKPGSAPDINLVGRIDNVGGKVKVHSKAGTIRSEGTVRAGTVDIQANNGDFVQSYKDEFFQLAVPADPSGNQTQLPGTASNGSLIMANGSVLLSARYLNINGTVQSGYANYELNIGGQPMLTASLAAMGFTQGDADWAKSLGTGDAALNGDLVAFAGRGKVDGVYYNRAKDRLEFTTAYAKADYAAKADKTVSAYALIQNTENTSDKQYIGASYDVKSNRLVVDGTAVQGGYIQIYGQVYNTAQNGAGKLKALDGYGQINITNTSGLDIELTKLDTGKGVAGVIEISDIQSFNDTTGVATIKKTTYTRENGKVKVAVVNVDKSTSTSWGAERTANYNPQTNLAYTFQTGSDASKRTDYRWQGTQWLGNTDWRTDGAPVDGSTVLSGPYDLQNTKLEQAQFLSVRNGFTRYGAQAAEEVKGSAGDARKFKTNQWSVCDWWFCVTQQYYIDYSIVTPIKTIQSTIIKADNPIGIEFIGADTGKINVQSNSNVLLSGAIHNKVGKTTIEAGGVAKSIVRTNDDALVSAASFDFKATASVGAAGMAIKTETVDKAVPGLFNAAATQGNVHIDQTQGAIKVGTITAGGTRHVAAKADANGTVTQAAVFNDVGVVELKAQGDIVAGAGSESLIQGDKVDLRSATGAIGSTAAPLTVNVAYSDDLTTRGFNGLTASAAKDIGIKTNTWAHNADGNLLLNTVASSGGDVKLVAPGRMVDNNPNETIDRRTWGELIDYWDSLGLRSGTDANLAKQTKMLKTYVEAKNAEYKDYWQLRKNAQEDATSGKLVFKLSEQQIASFKAQGTSDADIAQIVVGKQKALDDLGKVYGVGNSPEYNAHFDYVMSQKETDDLLRGVAWTDKQLAVAISPGALKTITNTNPVVKVANVQGNTVSLQAGKGIGETYVATPIDLKNFDPSKLTPAQKVALAAAERSDFGFKDNMLTVLQRKPLNFDASTQLNASGVGADSAINGTAFLASLKDGNLGTINVSGETRIKVRGSLVNAGASSVRTGNLVLEAADGAIGAGVRAPLELQLGAGSTLTARAAMAVAVHDSGNMQVDAVYSRDAIYLAADGSMTRAADNDLLNVLGTGVTLNAGRSIGATDKALNVAVGSKESLINATSDEGSVYLAGVSGNRFLVDSVTAANSIGLTSQDDLAIAGKLTATTGDITLSTAGAVLDGGAVADAVVAQAQNGTVTINAKAGVGTAGNAFEVQAKKLQASASQGAVTMTVAQNTGVELVGEGVTARDGVTLLANGGVTGTAVTSTGVDKNVTIAAKTGGVSLTKVSSGGDATLTASAGSVVATTLLATGAIKTDAKGTFDAKTINAKALTANANAIVLGQATVTDATDLTATGLLSATTLTTGTVTAKSTGGSVNLSTLTSTGNATITAEGGATLGTATVGDKDHAADLTVTAIEGLAEVTTATVSKDLVVKGKSVNMAQQANAVNMTLTATGGDLVATRLVATGAIGTGALGRFDATELKAKALTANADTIALGQATVTDATDLAATRLLSATTLTTGSLVAKSTFSDVNMTTLTSTGNATITAQGNATLGTATVGDKDHAADLMVTATEGLAKVTTATVSKDLVVKGAMVHMAQQANAVNMTLTATGGDLVATRLVATGAIGTGALGRFDATELKAKALTANADTIALGQATVTDAIDLAATRLLSATTLTTGSLVAKSTFSDVNMTTLTSTGNATITAQRNATLGAATVGDKDHAADLKVTAGRVALGKAAVTGKADLTATDEDVLAKELAAAVAVLGAKARAQVDVLKAKQLQMTADAIGVGQADVDGSTELSATKALTAARLATGSLAATAESADITTLTSVGHATLKTQGSASLGTVVVGDAKHASDLTVTASKGAVDVASVDVTRDVVLSGTNVNVGTLKNGRNLSLTATTGDLIAADLVANGAVAASVGGALRVKSLSGDSVTASAATAEVTSLNSHGNAAFSTSGDATFGSVSVGDAKRVADFGVTASAGVVKLSTATVSQDAVLKGNQVLIGSLTAVRDATLEASKGDVTATAPSIAATVLKANRLAVTTPGTLLLTDAMVGDSANFVLRSAKAKLRNDGKAPMVVSVSGKNEDVADNVDLQITSARGVDFRKLWAKVATVASSTNQNGIRDGYITGQLAYESPIGALWMNNVDRTSVVGKRVQLFADTKRFTLLQEGNSYVTDAFVSYFDPLNVYAVSTNTNFNAAPGANTGVSLERDTNKLQSGNALSDIRSRYTAATLSGITDLRTVDFNALPPTAAGVTEEEAKEWEQYISQAQ
ncbi:leukotoxin LktA family filamentous adhesin [Rhodoferax aquaticus]|uniref:Leukotoxin LktA family filamentous adhesin n=1 Tax=Rhodoferax aquaticus TaxID=2527691 RepID=A0A515EP82_9BURK|nr:leukotoxin LktA family filamentous adhesin [Rhodoferax aquaticus]QDL54472.1 leukotoxin LktA family filamentous adhesin [Rhodoferax aquaticus]